MIIVLIAFTGFGIYFLVRGDGPARIVGVILLLVAALFAALLWIAFTVELPPVGAYHHRPMEGHHV